VELLLRWGGHSTGGGWRATALSRVNKPPTTKKKKRRTNDCAGDSK
jgi:hypothetical protein